MTELDNQLLVPRLRAIVEAAAGGGVPSAEQWIDAEQVFHAHAWEDEEIETALIGRDAATLARRIQAWESGTQALPASDRAVLKRALKAFRKRLKLQHLDDESRIGGGPFSGGRKSAVVAIQPPGGYPPEVWEELARQERLRHTGQGFFELSDE